MVVIIFLKNKKNINFLYLKNKLLIQLYQIILTEGNGEVPTKYDKKNHLFRTKLFSFRKKISNP